MIITQQQHSEYLGGINGDIVSFFHHKFVANIYLPERLFYRRKIVCCPNKTAKSFENGKTSKTHNQGITYTACLKIRALK